MSIEKFSVEKFYLAAGLQLFSFTMTRPAHFKFTAGQFARIGLKVGEELVVRAYSVVSSPFDETLEFFDCSTRRCIYVKSSTFKGRR